MKCETCKFAVEFRPDPTQLRPSLLCKRFPPSSTTLPGPQGQIARLASQPIVNAQDYCYEFVIKVVDG